MCSRKSFGPDKEKIMKRLGSQFLSSDGLCHFRQVTSVPRVSVCLISQWFFSLPIHENLLRPS